MALVRTATFGLVVAALIAFAAAPAQAQDAEKARQLFQQGSKYYDLGQFDKAIEAWQQGYDQKPDPGFLYNIAQAYRQKQDAAKAIFFYKGYLRNSPKAHNRAEVDQKIAALQKQLDAGAPPPGNGTTAARQRDAAARTTPHRRRTDTSTADGDEPDRAAAGAHRDRAAAAAARLRGRADDGGRADRAAGDGRERRAHRLHGRHRSGVLVVGRERNRQAVVRADCWAAATTSARRCRALPLPDGRPVRLHVPRGQRGRLERELHLVAARSGAGDPAVAVGALVRGPWTSASACRC